MRTIRIGRQPLILLRLRPVRDAGPKSQSGRSSAESCTGETPSPTATPSSQSDSDKSLGRSWNVLHFEESVLLSPDGEQYILVPTEFSRLYPASWDTLQAPEAVEALPHYRTSLITRYGPSRPVEENCAKSYLPFHYSQPVYEIEEMHRAPKYHCSYSDRRILLSTRSTGAASPSTF